MIVLGYDPGGRSRNAVALLRSEGNQVSLRSADVESALEGLDWLEKECGPEIPTHLGIDTFLHWSLSAGGWRPSDLALRRNYSNQAASVLSMNSTFGSMVGQGMAMAFAARSRWPNILLNEVHPKIVHSEMFKTPYVRGSLSDAADIRMDQLRSLDLKIAGDLTSEDQFDALLCCIATYLGSRDNWFDLAASAVNNSSIVFPMPNISFYWPTTNLEA